MDREQMKLAILKQEQTFRQQVHELHRLYHVQKQLMQQMHLPAAQATANQHVIKKPKQEEFQIVHRDNKPMKPDQLFSLSSSGAMAPALASADEHSCSLELTLATGPSSSSGGVAGTGGTQKPGSKRLRSSSNSDSGTTAVSSTSTESELALFGEVGVTEKAAAVRFQSEARRMDEMRHQGAWMYQCLSLRTA